MRHGNKNNNLGRKTAHRRALLSNLTCQLIEHKRITTTLAKAKVLRGYAEPLINRSKEDSTHNRRVIFSYLQDKNAIIELFGTISAKVADRPGGYTRIIKLPRRNGDAADMALIELVDFNETYTKSDKDIAAKKTRRSRRSTAAAAKPAAQSAAASTAAAETATADMAAEETTNETVAPTAADEAEMPVAEDKTPAEENGTANELPENQ